MENGRVDINDKGDMIVFTSSADLTGDNPAEVPQLFLYNMKNNKLKQLSFVDENEFVERCSISGDGKWIAFSSNTNCLGTNPDKLRQVFLIDVVKGEIKQLTYGKKGEARAPVISGNGEFIVFSSSFDLLGTNPDHIHQIYIIKRDGTSLKQLTNLDKYCSRPAISWDGRRIVFLLHNRTPDNPPIGLGGDICSILNDGTNLFYYTSVESNIVQLRPAISGNGNVIAWESTADLTGENSDGSREIFVCHFGKRDFKQITHGRLWDRRFITLFQRPYLNYTGSIVYFEGTEDINGKNPNLWLQIFVAPTHF